MDYLNQVWKYQEDIVGIVIVFWIDASEEVLMASLDIIWFV